MNVASLVGLALITIGVIVYLFRKTVFWALLFGMFDPAQLSDIGHTIFKGFGLFLMFEGGLVLLLA